MAVVPHLVVRLSFIMDFVSDPILKKIIILLANIAERCSFW